MSLRFHKMAFYAEHALTDAIVPHVWWLQRRDQRLSTFHQLPSEIRQQVMARVRYYNRLQQPFASAPSAQAIGQCSGKGQSSAYYYDFRKAVRYFPATAKVAYQFGDITTVPDQPHFVKSRPIASAEDNANSVLLKLNSVRHYFSVADRLRFEDKKPLAVWRGKSNQPDRIAFARQYRQHPLCDIGCVQHKETEPQDYHRGFMPISEQLNHQFVVSVEGIDVATNLKWIMNSNSLCMMRRPRFETWFMEGSLKPGVHYVELNEDYSDLEEKILHYRRHPDEALAIIANAQHHAAQFKDVGRERLISLLVIDRYLRLSQQL